MILLTLFVKLAILDDMAVLDQVAIAYNMAVWCLHVVYNMSTSSDLILTLHL